MVGVKSTNNCVTDGQQALAASKFTKLCTENDQHCGHHRRRHHHRHCRRPANHQTDHCLIFQTRSLRHGHLQPEQKCFLVKVMFMYKTTTSTQHLPQ